MSLLFLLFSVNAWAVSLSEWQAATVKVESFPCLTEAPRFQGSGLAFTRDGAIYVLTSEHVVLHSVEACHQAADAALELVRADFGAGLALLKVKDPSTFSVQALEWKDLTAAPAAPGLTALGYPGGSADLVTLAEGKLLTARGRRALIAGVEYFIEAADLPVEYGMSGGLLLNFDQGFAGILSHQVLKREAGRATRPGDLSPGPGNLHDLALAIPAHKALAWAEKETGPVWQRDAKAQVEGKEVLRFGPLLFTLRADPAGDVWDIGGSDASGIGGDGEGFVAETEEILTNVAVSFAPGVSSAEKAAALGSVPLDRWRQWLLAGKDVRVVFLKLAGVKRLRKIESLAQFLTFWQRDGYEPLAIRTRERDSTAESEELARRARTLANLAQMARDGAVTVERKAWFALLRDTGVLAESLLVSSAEVSGLLTGEHDRYWREFYEEDFDGAVNLNTAIEKLVEQLKKLGL